MSTGSILRCQTYYTRLRNDLLCVTWDVQLHQLN